MSQGPSLLLLYNSLLHIDWWICKFLYAMMSKNQIKNYLAVNLIVVRYTQVPLPAYIPTSFPDFPEKKAAYIPQTMVDKKRFFQTTLLLTKLQAYSLPTKNLKALLHSTHGRMLMETEGDWRYLRSEITIPTGALPRGMTLPSWLVTKKQRS